ncbi:MAG: DUF2341 domain-containing protein [Kiritimatiellaeota bacterium]|nr:DUF2341 domain-containing protein [Kiritimatiellota bacterium]
MRKTIIMVCAAAFSAVMARAEGVSLLPWQMEIEFTGYAGAETLTNFPALVRLGKIATTNMLENGADLRFTDAKGDSIPYEIDTWDTNGVSHVWVCVPELDANTVIHARWGNPYAAAPDNTADTWGDGFMLVQHYNDADGTAVADSSPANRAAIVRNASGARDAGKIGGALDLSGTDDTSGVELYYQIDMPAEWSISAWFMGLVGEEVGYRTLTRATGGIHHVLIEADNNHLGAWTGDMSWDTVSTLDPDDPPEWRHIVAVGATNTTAYYINGELLGMGLFQAWDNIKGIGFNQEGPGSQRFADYLDEVRIASYARSADWVRAEYDTVTDANFAVCGAPAPVAIPYDIVTLLAVNVAWDSAGIVGYCAEQGSDILLYYGKTDGTNNPAAWDNAPIPLVNDEAGFFTAPLVKLKEDSAYFARFAVNDGGTLVWSDESVSFETPVDTFKPFRDKIIFVDCTVQEGGVHGTQRGLTINLPGGDWIWAKGFDWGPPGIQNPWNGNPNSYSNGDENSATGLPLFGDNGFVKPSLIQVRMGFSGQAFSGIGFWSELEPHPGWSDLTPHANSTAVLYHHGNGTIDVRKEYAVMSSDSIEPTGYCEMEIAVDTDSGDFAYVLVNGKLFPGLTSADFTDSATRYVGFLTSGGARLWANDFHVASPELLGKPWVATRGIENIAPESVDLSGYLGITGAAPFTVYLCYSADGDCGATTLDAWDAAIPLPQANARGAFTHHLDGLEVDTRYFFRFCIVDDEGETGWSERAFDFLTLGAAVLGDVTHTITPEAVKFSADVIQPGLDGLLTLRWGTEPDNLAWTMTESNFSVGIHDFLVKNLNKYDHCWYELVLSSTYGAMTNSGDFDVFYTFVWQEGNDLWKTASKWDINTVPNASNDMVRINNSWNTLYLTGMGEATVGRIDTYLYNGWRDWVYIESGDGSGLHFDNGADDAYLTINGNNHFMRVHAPLRLDSPTRVCGWGGGEVHLAGPISGTAPLIPQTGGVCFSAGAGETVVFDYPNIIHDGGDYIMRKSGAGEVVLKDVEYNLRAFGWWFGFGFIDGGGTFTFTNAVFNQINNWDSGNLFDDNFNTWRILENSMFDNTVGGNMYFNGISNTVLVSGVNARFRIPRLQFNGAHNTIRIEDGAAAFFAWGCNFSGGEHNTIAVGRNGSPSAPAVLDLNNGNFNCDGSDNVLAAATGGTVTNAANLSVSNGRNTLKLEGGEVWCDVFDVYADNALAVTLDAGVDIKPVHAGNYAWFQDGSKIIAENLDETGGTFGRFPLITATELYIEPALNDPAFLEASGKFMWRLRIVENKEPRIVGEEEEAHVEDVVVSKTLWLSCNKNATVIVVR